MDYFIWKKDFLEDNSIDGALWYVYMKGTAESLKTDR